jgi:hypothetical protein
MVRFGDKTNLCSSIINDVWVFSKGTDFGVPSALVLYPCKSDYIFSNQFYIPGFNGSVFYVPRRRKRATNWVWTLAACGRILRHHIGVNVCLI